MFTPRAGHTMSSQQISRGGNHENSDDHPDSSTEKTGQHENNNKNTMEAAIMTVQSNIQSIIKNKTQILARQCVNR
ncbi:MAG: hypothetical protein MK118_01995 [Dehalococcoidia bacterium]|nr:hypothetical protein [Dehalococcoidia bacterium]